MSRIAGVPLKTRNPVVRFAYRSVKREFGRDLEPTEVYAHTPVLMLGYGAFEKATARQHRVDERLKVLAETKVAALVNCEFCCDIASSLALAAGVTEEQLLALPRYRDSDAFSELERLVLDYTVAISRTPTTVTDEMFAALREHFDERQMVELTNIIVLENMRARFNSAFDMTPAGFREGLVCAIPERESPSEPAPVALASA
ncbi:MAG TPA: carboxymuconolactone decarboxylase family protein [Solirubrobacteraceae bacterium]|nr:carboxymuconolactone decarboxylase family protein [Solirubrobacteraceae bacterium]